MISPLSSGSLSRSDIRITVGTVAATDSRVAGGTIQRGETQADLQVQPVIWLQDETGTEHAFEGRSVSAARTGHKMVVVCKRSDGKILRVYNLSTHTKADCNELVPLDDGPQNLLSGAFLLSVIGIIPFTLIYTTVATFLHETFIGRRGNAFDLWPHFPYIAILLFLGCFWMTHRWIANSEAKANALSVLIDDAVRSQGLLDQQDA